MQRASGPPIVQVLLVTDKLAGMVVNRIRISVLVHSRSGGAYENATAFPHSRPLPRPSVSLGNLADRKLRPDDAGCVAVRGHAAVSSDPRARCPVQFPPPGHCLERLRRYTCQGVTNDCAPGPFARTQELINGKTEVYRATEGGVYASPGFSVRTVSCCRSSRLAPPYLPNNPRLLHRLSFNPARISRPFRLTATALACGAAQNFVSSH
jgi:hypothetical protein